MSVHFSAAVWRMQMPATRKLVALSLADQANDEGQCWPSLRHMAERTGLGRATVIRIIADLEASGFLVASRTDGRKNSYTLTGLTVIPVNRSKSKRNQSHRETGSTPQTGITVIPVSDQDPSHGDTGTSLTVIPVNGTDPSHGETGTGLTVRRDQSHGETPDLNRQGNINKPVKRFDPLRDVELPSCVPRTAWSEFVQHRRERNKPLTALSARKALKTLAEMAAAGHDPVKAIDTAITSGWLGVFTPRSPPTSPPRLSSPPEVEGQPYRSKVAV